MTVSELLPALSHLTRTDKLRVMQRLATELVEEEAHLTPGAEYPVWSPHTAHEAADALLSALAAEKPAHHSRRVFEVQPKQQPSPPPAPNSP